MSGEGWRWKEGQKLREKDGYLKWKEDCLLPHHRREGKKTRTDIDINIVVNRENQDAFLLMHSMK